MKLLRFLRWLGIIPSLPKRRKRFLCSDCATTEVPYAGIYCRDCLTNMKDFECFHWEPKEDLSHDRNLH